MTATVLQCDREAAEPRWTCFHCGDSFTDEMSARLHFGRSELSEAACLIKAGAEGSLLRALRQAEEAADNAIQMMHDESTDAAKAYHSQRCRHNQALIAAEELGYERGLADGRALSTRHDSTSEMVEALKLAHPIVEADLETAQSFGDGDWIGMSQTALDAINATLQGTDR